MFAASTEPARCPPRGRRGEPECDVPLGGFQQLDQQLAHGGLAAARLSNQAEALALPQPEGHIIHGIDETGGLAEHARGEGEAHGQPVHGDQRLSIPLGLHSRFHAKATRRHESALLKRALHPTGASRRPTASPAAPGAETRAGTHRWRGRNGDGTGTPWAGSTGWAVRPAGSPEPAFPPLMLGKEDISAAV